MSELYHEIQLPLDFSSQQEQDVLFVNAQPRAKRSYVKGQSLNNPPAEIKYCEKCGCEMHPKWEVVKKRPSGGRWRYRCSPCRKPARQRYQSTVDNHKKWQRTLELHPDESKKRNALAKQKRIQNGIPKPVYPHSSKLYKLRQYGLTAPQYDEMLEKQGFVCAICKKPESMLSRAGKVRELAIDHDHQTGKVRALLCYRCNIGLGLFDEDPNRLRAMAEYLEFHRMDK